jgi:hypothetical protein
VHEHVNSLFFPWHKSSRNHLISLTSNETKQIDGMPAILHGISVFVTELMDRAIQLFENVMRKTCWYTGPTPYVIFAVIAIQGVVDLPALLLGIGIGRLVRFARLVMESK